MEHQPKSCKKNRQIRRVKRCHFQGSGQRSDRDGSVCGLGTCAHARQQCAATCHAGGAWVSHHHAIRQHAIALLLSLPGKRMLGHQFGHFFGIAYLTRPRQVTLRTATGLGTHGNAAALLRRVTHGVSNFCPNLAHECGAIDNVGARRRCCCTRRTSPRNQASRAHTPHP